MPESPSIKYSDRLLAESVRLLESDSPTSAPLPEGASAEERIVRRAASIDADGSLRTALHAAARTGALIVVGALILALGAGLGVAGAVLGAGRDEPVNLLGALGALLGVQTLLLLLWVVSMVIGPRLVRGASIGAAAAGVAGAVIERLPSGRRERAAAGALVSTQTAGAAGRWTFGAITHGAWLAFNVGALGALLYALAARHYTFAWETTILSREDFAHLFRLLGAPLEAIGLASPSPEMVRASELDPAANGGFSQSEPMRRSWAEFLIAALTLYGAVPRVFLAAVSLAARRLALRRLRLDLTRPYYAQLLEADAARSAEVVADDSDAEWVSPEHDRRAHAPRRPQGPPAIVGIEMDEPDCGWPPPVGSNVQDLGRVDGREAQRRILDQLRAGETEPAPLIIGAELAATPDRGMERLIGEIAASIANPPLLLLTPGRALGSTDAGEGARRAESRLQDWRTLAVRAGIPSDRVISVDLDHLTERTRETLQSLAAPDESLSGARPRLLPDALELIVEAAEKQRLETERERLDLHERIARLYGAGAARGALRRLGLPEITDAASARAAMQESARRFSSMLPEWLRAEPKWLAAGAVAGALGCAAAAMLVAPAAIGSLPLWSGLGAAFASLGPALREREPEEQSDVDIGESIRAAALWSALLELQGLPEDALRRILAQSVTEEQARARVDRSSARAWLDEFRRCFERAVEQEGAS